MPKPKHVLIVDDHDYVRKMLRDFFANEPGFTICGEATDGLDAIEKARELRPELIILDLLMPNMNGLAAARLLKKLLPRTPIVMLTLHHDAIKDYQIDGVDAVVAKGSPISSLLNSVKGLVH